MGIAALMYSSTTTVQYFFFAGNKQETTSNATLTLTHTLHSHPSSYLGNKNVETKERGEREEEQRHSSSSRPEQLSQKFDSEATVAFAPVSDQSKNNLDQNHSKKSVRAAWHW